MATGETKIPALPLDINPTGDDYALSVDVGTGTSKKVPFAEISKALDYSNSLSTDTNNLIVLGTDDKIRVTAQDELISIDASNTISVGSDGKLYGSATALTLNENELFVGNVSNQPVSTSANDVKQLLGLPTDYKNVSVVRNSGTQVTVQGKCRSEQDDIDLELSSATPVALLTPTANTRYNLFFAKVNSASPTVALFDTASAPAGYAHYRNVLTISTDSVSSLPIFNYDGDNNYLSVELWSGNATTGTISLSDSVDNFKTILFLGYDTFFAMRGTEPFLSSEIVSGSAGDVFRAHNAGNNWVKATKVDNSSFNISSTANNFIYKVIGVL